MEKLEPEAVYDEETLIAAYHYAEQHQLDLHLVRPGSRASGVLRIPLLKRVLSRSQRESVASLITR